MSFFKKRITSQRFCFNTTRGSIHHQKSGTRYQTKATLTKLEKHVAEEASVTLSILAYRPKRTGLFPVAVTGACRYRVPVPRFGASGTNGSAHA